MERLEIIETLKHFPDRLEAALAGIPEGVLRTSPSEGEWSIKQILGHLDYAEEIWYRRLYQVWSLHDPVLMSFNEDAERSAIELAAGASDVRTYVNSIRAKRPRIVNLLALAVDWTRTGQWRGEGRRSLKQLAEILLAHDAEHLARIAEIKGGCRYRSCPLAAAVEIGKTFYPETREQWRGWLEKHHASEPEIWLISYLKATGKPSLPYNDAVEEALCFGWIDSTRKTLTEDSRAQRFSPRRKGAPWSEMNKERVRRLHAQGLMTEAGLAAGVDFLDEAFEVPDDILAAINADEETRAHFERFPESYVRIRVGWIDGVRNRPEEFDKRLRYFLKMTKQGKRFGMVQ